MDRDFVKAFKYGKTHANMKVTSCNITSYVDGTDKTLCMYDVYKEAVENGKTAEFESFARAIINSRREG